MKLNNLYILLVLMVLLGCSTKKNTWLSRNYHDLTAHYNVYFNGKESFKEGVKAIEESNVDDYTQVLAVFPDSKESSKDVAVSEMDRAIEKGTKLIKKHSITKKPKRRDGDNSIKYQKFISQNEFNKWVDNAYLLIGKANFFKHDYHIAQQSFEYMFREFRTGPEWYEAEIWNARAAIELQDYSRAKILLDNYDIEGKAPDRLFGFFSAVYADYFLQQQMYEEALPYLQKAKEGAWNRYYKLRLNFILAQVYHKLKRYNDANLAYKAVIRMNPPYEMAFNAKVNRASVMFGEGGLPAVQKEIAKLLRDKRNQDYEDQIYYALAMAYIAEKQEEEAVDNLLLSVQKSVSNDYQKGLSFYQLADIYYEKPEYKPAYSYLDSALYNLDETFYDYQTISELHKGLESLVTRINTVEREDSLQRIAKMSETQRLAFIDNLIEQEKEKQEELKKKQQESSENLYFGRSLIQSSSSVGGSGKWYFYNTNSVALGKSEFERKWGRRKLEDNWRRANKEVVVTEIEEPGSPDDIFGDPFSNDMGEAAGEVKDSTKKETGVVNLLSRDAYLKDLPLTEEELKLSDNKIEEALIMMGVIYKDQIENIPYAIDAFNELIQRFPHSIYLEDALMNLYLCYEIQNDHDNMARIKKQILEQYPDGEFTAFLNDPDYFKKREERIAKIELLYEEAYSEYLFSHFETPITNYQKASEIDKENELLPKFKFLTGLSYAKLGNLEKFNSELEDVVKQYPDAEVTPLAKEMLAMYGQGRIPVQGPVTSNLNELRDKEFQLEQKKRGVSDSAERIATSFEVNNNATHSLVLIVNSETDINRLKFNIADYNFSKFLLNDYEMTELNLPDRTPIVAINGFNNRLEALDYFYSIRERKEIFEVDNLEDYQLYVINQGNLEYLISSGDVEGYEIFFGENYMSAEAFKKSQTEEVKKEEQAKQEQQVSSKISQEEVGDKKLAVEPKVIKIETKEQPDKATEVKVEKENLAAVSESAIDVIKVQETKEEERAEVEKEDVEEVKTQEKEPSILEESADVGFVEEDGPYSALVLFKKGRINIQRTGTIFKNYSKANFGSHLETEFGPKGAAWLYIKVSGFASAEDAKAYVQKVRLDSYLMREISRMKYYTWVITENNYQRLTDEASFEKYQDFYEIIY